MTGEKRECACPNAWVSNGGGHMCERPRDFFGAIFGALDRVAETTAGEREVNIIQRIVNAWDCCGTCAGGVLAAHDRATADRVRREEGERIAQAIEAASEKWPAGPSRGDYVECALIARAASVGRGEGL